MPLEIQIRPTEIFLAEELGYDGSEEVNSDHFLFEQGSQSEDITVEAGETFKIPDGHEGILEDYYTVIQGRHPQDEDYSYSEAMHEAQETRELVSGVYKFPEDGRIIETVPVWEGFDEVDEL